MFFLWLQFPLFNINFHACIAFFYYYFVPDTLLTSHLTFPSCLPPFILPSLPFPPSSLPPFLLFRFILPFLHSLYIYSIQFYNRKFTCKHFFIFYYLFNLLLFSLCVWFLCDWNFVAKSYWVYIRLIKDFDIYIILISIFLHFHLISISIHSDFIQYWFLSIKDLIWIRFILFKFSKVKYLSYLNFEPHFF